MCFWSKTCFLSQLLSSKSFCSSANFASQKLRTQASRVTPKTPQVGDFLFHFAFLSWNWNESEEYLKDLNNLQDLHSVPDLFLCHLVVQLFSSLPDLIFNIHLSRGQNIFSYLHSCFHCFHFLGMLEPARIQSSFSRPFCWRINKDIWLGRTKQTRKHFLEKTKETKEFFKEVALDCCDNCPTCFWKTAWAKVHRKKEQSAHKVATDTAHKKHDKGLLAPDENQRITNVLPMFLSKKTNSYELKFCHARWEFSKIHSKMMERET